jgi:hypothetical protein
VLAAISVLLAIIVRVHTLTSALKARKQERGQR